MAVTLKDIAERAKVSRSAVSLFLNNSETKHVSAENKKRILKAIDLLGYRPNYAARSLRGGASMTIGIVGGMFSVPVHDAINNALMHELWRHGYQALLGENIHKNTTTKTICAELESRGVDALIITSAASEKEKENISVPFISVTHNQAYFDIAIDMEYGGYLAGKHLIEHGHRKISYVSSSLKDKGRFSGLENALSEAGFNSCKKFRVKKNSKNSEEKIITLVKDSGVSAFFCINDFTAVAVMKLLQDNGIKVPEDVAIIGFDGLAFTEFTSPALTTVVQPVQELATESVKLLLNKLKGVKKTQKIKLIKPYLVHSGSCGCDENLLQDIYSAGSKFTLDYFKKESLCQH
jgi:LacI family transcriptional regulator, galactose operon repressor